MNKKIILVAVVISVILFCFFIPEKKAEQKTTVSFYTLQLGTFREYMNSVIEKFEALNPDIKINWIDVPYSEGEKRALASVLSDNTPDIFNLTPDFSQSLAQKNALFWIDEKYLEQFSPALLQSVKFQDKYYAFPFYATSAITLYNSDLISSKDVPVTYRELFKYCGEYNHSGTYLTMISFNENDTLLKILNKYGLTDAEDIIRPESIELFKTLRVLYRTNKLPKESITQSHREGLEKYMSGQIAVLNAGVNFINIIKENAPLVFEKTKISPQLASENGEYDYSLMNLIIPKKAKHKEEAIKFVLFLTNKDNQLEFSRLTSVLSTNKYALEDDYFNKKGTDLIEDARYISSKQLNNPIKAINLEKNRKEIISLTSIFIQKVLLTDEDISELCEKYYKDRQKLAL